MRLDSNIVAEGRFQTDRFAAAGTSRKRDSETHREVLETCFTNHHPQVSLGSGRQPTDSSPFYFVAKRREASGRPEMPSPIYRARFRAASTPHLQAFFQASC